MTGLISGWEALQTVRFPVCASSASGASLEGTLSGIPLSSALVCVDFDALRVRSEDGSSLLLSFDDAAQAMLVSIPGGWQLILPQDTTRRRWLKNPMKFDFFPLNQGVIHENHHRRRHP